MHTRALPWVGMGTTGEWTDPEEALYESDLSFEVEQVQVYDDKGTVIPGVLANRRCDSGAILGHTSDQYGVVQNYDAFNLLAPFCQTGGVIEHAGMTEAGMMFMVMRMGSHAFGFAGDEFEVYVCAMNSFNARFPLALIITPIRVYCQNMFRKLMARGDTALLIKHGRLARDRVLSATSASSLLLGYQSDFIDQLMFDSHQTRTQTQVEAFSELLLPLAPEDKAHPRAKSSNERVRRQREEFVNDYYHAEDNWAYEGSRLGILNAYYDWVTHHVPTKTSANYDQLRFGNLLNGTAVSNKLLANA